jgi:uncharacterized protein YegJ (DUF2314 family)
MNTGRLVAVIILIIISAGIRIAVRSSLRPSTPSSNTHVFAVDKDDPAMNAAMARARNNVLHFQQHIAKPGADEQHFAVKMAVHDGDDVEYFWLANTTWDGNVFRGEIDDEAETVSNVQVGQKMICAPTDIADWMYVKAGRLVGGETIRVIRDKMTEDDRREFDAGVPFRFN